MKIIKKSVTSSELQEIKTTFGEYFKTVIDLEKEILLLGCEFHVDGAEKLRYEQYSNDDNLWGGWLHIGKKEILFSAVYNIRPRLGNPNMEILDAKRREKFEKITKNIFAIIFAI